MWVGGQALQLTERHVPGRWRGWSGYRGHGGKGRTSVSDLPFLGGSFRNSSASPSTKFMCRSNAMNLRAQRGEELVRTKAICTAAGEAG